MWYNIFMDELQPSPQGEGSPLDESCVIYSGEKFTLEWYYDKDGKSVAYDFF